MDNIISFGGNMTAKINFAMQQNYVPVFRNIIMTNNSESELSGVKARISFEPEFAAVFETAEMTLKTGVPVEIAPVNIVMKPDFLFSLTEKIVGNVKIQAIQGENILAETVKTIELHAYDQWTGVIYMPETACAFMTPNHPKVSEIVAKAGAYLKKWCGDPSFTAYQTKNPNMVRTQMAAVYAALQAENIAYTMPPASFEEAQRIRMPDNVLEGKSGTCLDLAVLYCSCLEAVGLHSLLIIVSGHAFAGCWLEEETFSDSIQYDCSAIAKRIAKGIDLMSVVECTDFTAGKGTDFDIAEKHAGDRIAEHDSFVMAIDVRRTRASGIRPIPSRISDNGTFRAVDYGKRKRSEITSAPRALDLSNHASSDGGEREVTKQVVWERKLLDLSLRNSLLNFRPTSSNVQLMTADLGVLEDEISNGESFKVMPRPSDFTLKLYDSKIYEIENQRDLITAIAHDEFRSHRLRTFLTDSELERIMKKLHRQAKVSIEENGANTLYLALGFLRWYETDKSDRARYAPLVLVPVDIIRKVQDKSYSIRIRDEEIQVNITLLEMLRQFFGIDIKGLSPIPQDESGINLPLVFNTVRQGVMAKERWDIEEYAFIGQFSFSRFIMWNDIRNRSDELAANKVVASLISGKTEWESDDIAMSPADLDEKISPSELAVPTSADSSQLAAIYAASCGKSFVLHGPPGTGKSQTITNMIANALYHGKSVLFVAEKMAALSVVENRLSKIGLAPFCLELHSNKAQKRAVLKQLEETLYVGKVKSPQEYKAQADKLKGLRQELNSVMRELHRSQNIGKSLYDLITEYDRLRELSGKIVLGDSFADSFDAEKYNNALEIIRKTSVAGGECGGFTKSALKNYCCTEYSIEIRDSFRSYAESFGKYAEETKHGYTDVLGELSVSPNADYNTWTGVMDTLYLAKDGRFFPSELGGESVLAENKQAADELIACGNEYKNLIGELNGKFENTIFTVSGDNAKLEWKRNEQKWFLPKYFGKKKLVKEMQLHAKSAATVTADNYVAVCEQLSQYAQMKDKLCNADGRLTAVFGDMWKQENTDFTQLNEYIPATLEIREKLAGLGNDGVQLAQTLGKIIGNSVIKEKITAAENQRRRISEFMAELENKYNINFNDIKNAEDWLTAAENETDGWISENSLLRERSVLQGLLNEMYTSGIAAVREAYTSGKISEENMSDAFICASAQAVIADSFRKNPELAKFQGAQFEDTIKRYGELINEFSELTIKELVSELSAKIPAPGTSAGSSEIGILQRAIKSGGRMMSIRKLFDSIPNLLRRMCPCMLMSPISVAQYIDPSYPKFDLVIFDEASQLPTCEAVGAIARGENVIVVGDPKQLPPTSFFASNSVDEENYEKEDLESVLDDCLALSMPQKHLLWHYRSRHESLIAYSNAKYYENKLYTFPSPDDLVSEVSWIHVDGFYDKGASKQNIAEAKAVVEEISRRLSDPNLRKLSIGVVTFSLPQQNLIDDMLVDAFRSNPQLEQWANEMYEPLFIKNLENVQGDERDVILFSIGYGPDKEGKVSMNFGPLNRDGGWRRLNVAISRARRKMIVYSVITPDMIDLSRTRADGVEGLKGFLEFASKGRSALASRGDKTISGDSFGQIIAQELGKHGWSVKCGVGCSDYKIDAAVVNPDNPETYILGINCFGKRSFENGTARDRCVSQPSVLRGLGWNVINVHILDWLDNRERTIDKLLTEIENALERYRNAPEEEITDSPEKKHEIIFETEKVKELSELCSEYKPFSADERGTAESFTEENSAKIINCIKDVLKAEAPVSRDELAKKVFACWGITRAGSAMKKTFETALTKSGVFVSESGFVWNSYAESASYSECRSICSDENKRSMDDIAPEEIANGITLIMARQLAMDRSDLLRETAHLFGFTRMGTVIETAVSLGMKAARVRGDIAFSEDGRVTYTGK